MEPPALPGVYLSTTNNQEGHIMRKHLLTSLVALSLAAPAMAADSPTERAIKYRQAAMTVVGSNFKPMGAMIKGEIPFDAAVFARHAEDLSAIAGVDILRGFPEDSEGKGSDAKPDIWLDWEDFKAKMEDMTRETAALAKVAAGSDKAAIKDQFGKTAKTCKACHKAYKE
jgi:cytochrome c556